MTDDSRVTREAVSLSRDTLDAIARHGVATYPHECCGALIERDGQIVEAWPLDNTTSEGARRRFLVSPRDYLAAERRAGEIGGTLAGFYHSHPDHPARPSQHDLEHAWPNLWYVIVSVEDGVAGAMTVWRLRADRAAFEQKDLTWPLAS
jgi:proteasome lid subunit RPN8/RPN11